MIENQNAKWAILTPPQLKDNGALANNSYVDTAGWGHLEVAIITGVMDIALGSTTAATAPLLESDDAVAFSAATAITGAALAAAIAADGDSKIYKIDVDLMNVAHKRYVRVQAPTAGDGSAGVNACILARLSSPQGMAPNTAALRGLAEHVIAGA